MSSIRGKMESIAKPNQMHPLHALFLVAIAKIHTCRINAKKMRYSKPKGDFRYFKGPLRAIPKFRWRPITAFFAVDALNSERGFNWSKKQISGSEALSLCYGTKQYEIIEN